MEPVRIGIIGCGVIGTQHAAAAVKSSFTELTALADLQKEAVESMADEYSVDKHYTDAENLLEDPEVEGVVLAMPAFVRTDIAMQALKRGKHVLNEKPIAMNAGEVREMIDVKGDLVGASCSSRPHYNESAQRAREFIQDGNLGNLRVIRINGISGASAPGTPHIEWRYKTDLNAGGIMSNWGCYDLDYVLGLTGWKLTPVSVSARTWNIAPEFESRIAPGSDAETHVLALITCESGEGIVLERGEQIARRSRTAWEITGTLGTLHLCMVPGDSNQLIWDRATEDNGIESEIIWEGSETWEPMHAGPLENFAKAIRNKEELRTGFEEALIIRTITDAIYESSSTGKTVYL